MEGGCSQAAPGTHQVWVEPQQSRGCGGHCLPRGTPQHPQVMPWGFYATKLWVPNATALPVTDLTWGRRGTRLHGAGSSQRVLQTAELGPAPHRERRSGGSRQRTRAREEVGARWRWGRWTGRVGAGEVPRTLGNAAPMWALPSHQGSSKHTSA